MGVIGLNFFVYRWMGLYMGHFYMVELISGSLHYGTCKSKVVHTDYQIIAGLQITAGQRTMSGQK